jgi:hypothetical protein
MHEDRPVSIHPPDDGARPTDAADPDEGTLVTTGSRFAEEPEWSRPGDDARYVATLLPHVRDDEERALLMSAMQHVYLDECTDAESDAVRAVGARVGPSPHV